MMRPSRMIVAALLLAAWPTLALACPVCFGDASAPLTRSAAAGVMFMLVLTYSLLIVGFGGLLTFCVVRARRLALAGAAGRTDPASPRSDVASAG